MTAKIIEDPAYRERVFVFRDRLHAGRLLSEKLRGYAGTGRVVLLALPAGGVPVGYVVAKKLGIPMDVIVVRKVQIPWNTEAGFGALTWDGETVLNESLVEQLGLTREEIEESISKTGRIIQERLRKFRGDKSMSDLKAKAVILVDDGLASGFTMLAAVRSAKKGTPEKIIGAVPTASAGAIKLLAPEVDEIVCLNIRSGTRFAVADAYKNWYDLTDEEVVRILESAGKLNEVP
jgi:putative phosphoribosyl transferase